MKFFKIQRKQKINDYNGSLNWENKLFLQFPFEACYDITGTKEEITCSVFIKENNCKTKDDKKEFVSVKIAFSFLIYLNVKLSFMLFAV